MGVIRVFTSITANYLPKARVLARSIRSVAPDVQFSLVLCDDYPADQCWDDEPFDALITVEELIEQDTRGWIFGHRVVELCTAAKGPALERLLQLNDTEAVLYFDPDIVVLGSLDELLGHFAEASVLLTPHQTVPETDIEAIMDNEMASLKYGVFNLGFLGVKSDTLGQDFAAWWSDRLRHFCRDDRPAGLFTDQKWVNLAPCFFEGVCVLRSPAYNVATWNITTRHVSGDFSSGFFVNEVPLVFYHFSGFDSGDQALMLGKYGSENQSLADLRRWYLAACDEQGQAALGQRPGVYSFFDDGTAITDGQRRLYRERIDLQRAFPDPFVTSVSGGYHAWYSANAATNAAGSASGDGAGERSPAEVFGDFRRWLEGRAALSASPLRRLAIRSLNALLGVSARIFARSAP